MTSEQRGLASPAACERDRYGSGLRLRDMRRPRRTGGSRGLERPDDFGLA